MNSSINWRVVDDLADDEFNASHMETQRFEKKITCVCFSFSLLLLKMLRICCWIVAIQHAASKITSDLFQSSLAINWILFRENSVIASLHRTIHTIHHSIKHITLNIWYVKAHMKNGKQQTENGCAVRHTHKMIWYVFDYVCLSLCLYFHYSRRMNRNET